MRFIIARVFMTLGYYYVKINVSTNGKTQSATKPYHTDNHCNAGIVSW